MVVVDSPPRLARTTSKTSMGTPRPIALGSTPRQIWLDVLGQFPVYERQYHNSAVRIFKIEK